MMVTAGSLALSAALALSKFNKKQQITSDSIELAQMFCASSFFFTPSSITRGSKFIDCQAQRRDFFRQLCNYWSGNESWTDNA